MDRRKRKLIGKAAEAVWDGSQPASVFGQVPRKRGRPAKARQISTEVVVAARRGATTPRSRRSEGGAQS